MYKIWHHHAQINLFLHNGCVQLGWHFSTATLNLVFLHNPKSYNPIKWLHWTYKIQNSILFLWAMPEKKQLLTHGCYELGDGNELAFEKKTNIEIL